jgi:hypothetical protein
MIHYPSFLGLLRSGVEFECDLIIGGAEMPATLVWDADSNITAYGAERFAAVVNAPYKILSSTVIEVFCDDYKLGEQFVMATAGYIGSREWERLFGPNQ